MPGRIIVAQEEEMRVPWFSAVFAALTAGLLAASLLASTALAESGTNEKTYVAWLVDDNEVPKPGTPGGTGWAKVSVDEDARRVCWELATWGMDMPMAAHIHWGVPGVAGPIVVPLGAPDTQVMANDIPSLSSFGLDGKAVWYSTGCKDAVDRLTLRNIVDKPVDFYVNVHNMADPAGAAR